MAKYKRMVAINTTVTINSVDLIEKTHCIGIWRCPDKCIIESEPRNKWRKIPTKNSF